MVTIKEGEGKLYIPGDEDGKNLGEITFYQPADEPGTLVVDHTRVSEALRGQGAGEKLVRAVVDKAREEGLHIIPECSYAAHQFAKHPEYSDVLKQDS